ncbi:rod-binding protein [Arcobacter sp. s6]|jgi:peptidoglycan hydrolase FlgJ|uniref:rod-binding protein n=1 Tax=Arcobacter sp. s6 TaxID=3230363 RepID=UPI0034A0A38D
MEINTSNLINKDMLQTNKFENVKSAELKNKDEKQLKQVCDDFESYFLNQTLDVSLRSSNIAGEGTGSDIIKSMYIQAVADNSTGSLGISSMLYEFLTKNNK